MRIACISDVHGNHYALSTALRHIDSLNIDQIIFLGDIFGYYPCLKALDIILARGDIICIKGNHEQKILTESVSIKSDDIYKHQEILNTINHTQLAIIDSWHSYYNIENVFFFHGGPLDYQNQYLYPDSAFDKTYSEIRKLNPMITVCVSGHTHRAFSADYKDVKFVNAGSVSMPRDYGIFGSFVVVETQTSQADIYRFNIESDIKHMTHHYPHTHQSVIDLLERNKNELPQGIIL